MATVHLLPRRQSTRRTLAPAHAFSLRACVSAALRSLGPPPPPPRRRFAKLYEDTAPRPRDFLW